MHSHSVISYSVPRSMSSCHSVFILCLLTKIFPCVCLIITKTLILGGLGGGTFHTLFFYSHVVRSQTSKY